MENGAVNPRGAKLTDAQLREDLQAGLKPVDIARKHGVSKQAVSKRVNRLELTTTTAAVAPEESRRFVSGQINAIEQLNRGLVRVNLLMDACHEWLASADDPERYDVGARAEEVEVTYEVEARTASGSLVTQKRKKSLTEIMGQFEGEDDDGARFCGWKHGETKRADPRELILRTVAEGRQTVQAATELAKLLADAKAMQEWRDVVLDAIGRAAPDVRDAIIGEIRSSLVLRGLLDGPPGGRPN